MQGQAFVQSGLVIWGEVALSSTAGVRTGFLLQDFI